MKLNIRDKLVAGFSVIILFMIIGNAYVLFELSSVSTLAKTALTTDARIVTLAERLEETLTSEEQNTNSYLATKDSAYLSVASHNSVTFTALIDSLSTLARERPLLRRPLREIDLANAWVLTNIAEPHGTITVSDGTRSLQTPEEAFRYMRATLNQIFNYARFTITSSVADVEQKTRDTFAIALLLTGSTLLVAVLLAFWITRTITRPLYLLMKGTEQIARGSYAHIDLSSGDETAQLAQAFNSMSDRLNEINTYKAEMMQQISHEIRSPLQLVLFSFFVLTEQTNIAFDEKQRELLHAIRRNIDRITRFADAFLDLSRIEAGQMEFRFASVDMKALVQRAVDDATILAKPRSISIAVHAEDVPLLMADDDKCSQVISNLLNNAVKFSSDGGQITVSITPTRTGIAIGVEDSGMGIAADELPKLFTKFFRASNAANRSTKGTGLGLALVKAIIDGHGGKVGVKSELGKGSTFTVELPFIPSDRGVSPVTHNVQHDSTLPSEDKS